MHPCDPGNLKSACEASLGVIPEAVSAIVTGGSMLAGLEEEGGFLWECETQLEG